MTRQAAKTGSMAQVKAAVTIDDVLARYDVVVRRVGSRRVCACPICATGTNARSRAFVVSADGRGWYCFGDCRRGGSVIDLVMALERCRPIEAISRLRDWSA